MSMEDEGGDGEEGMSVWRWSDDEERVTCECGGWRMRGMCVEGMTLCVHVCEGCVCVHVCMHV